MTLQKTTSLCLVLLLVGCSSNNIKSTPDKKNDIASNIPPEIYYFDVSAGEKCKLKEAPAIKNKKLSLKPLVDKDGDWICEVKPVIYKVILSVKNIENITKEYELECDNPYGLMKECKGWGRWLTEMGPGPYMIESKGSPEVIPKSLMDNKIKTPTDDKAKSLTDDKAKSLTDDKAKSLTDDKAKPLTDDKAKPLTDDKDLTTQKN